MRRFDYERPTSLEEAMALLAAGGRDARLLAGGTDLVVGLRDGSIEPAVVIDLKRAAGLDAGIGIAEGHLRIGALAVMGGIESHAAVLRRFPALAEAARVVGSVQIRNRATLAGNICNASPAADTAPPLLVHDAVVVVAGRAGQRSVPMDDFIEGPDQTALRAGELVSAIELPLPHADFGAAYVRLVRRRGTDLASVTLCASIDGQGRVRVAYGSVGPRAFLVSDESGVLADADASEDARTAAWDRVFAQASPSARSIRAAPDYRLAMLRVLGPRELEVARSRLARGADAHG
ncbi:xanthine dehydrogenase family protein subunit M [soil metagenome]